MESTCQQITKETQRILGICFYLTHLGFSGWKVYALFFSGGFSFMPFFPPVRLIQYFSNPYLLIFTRTPLIHPGKLFPYTFLYLHSGFHLKVKMERG